MLKLDATTKAAYDAATTAPQRAVAVVGGLTGTVNCRVYNGSAALMGSGSMVAPWGVASGDVITAGEVASFAVSVSGTPDASWYLQFEDAGGHYVRGTFGLAGSGKEFTWSLATWVAGQSGSIGTALLTVLGPHVPVFTVAPTSATVAAGGTIQFTATDADGDTVSYAFDPPSAAVVAAAGYTINSSSGLVTAGSSSQSFRVRATDSGGLYTDSATCAVTVQAAITTLLTEDFSSSTWYTKWHNSTNVYAGTGSQTYTSSPARVTRVMPSYTGEGYVPNPNGSGYAIRVEVTSGLNDGTNLSFFPRLVPSFGINPTELYLEYWIRFATDWNPIINGKLPGLSGDFNDGAKGNAWDPAGMNGWSARSGYDKCTDTNKIAGSTYFYYMECGDRAGTPYEYSSAADPGQGMGWSNMSCGGSAVMAKNTWRKVKIYAKRNTGAGAAAQRNGCLKVWVDDVVRLNFTQILWTRNAAYQYVERAWMNVYHGGTAVATSNLHLFISDVRIWTP